MESEWDYCDQLRNEHDTQSNGEDNLADRPLAKFEDLNYYIFVDIMKYLSLKERVKLERISKAWQENLMHVTQEIQRSDLEHITSQRQLGEVYLSLTRKSPSLRKFSFDLLGGHLRSKLKNSSDRRQLTTELAQNCSKIEMFSDMEFDQHDDVERLKTVIMYCNACNVLNGGNRVKKVAINYMTLVKNAELLCQTLNLCDNLEQVKILIELYRSSSFQTVDEECYTLCSMWQQIGSRIKFLSLGHYFSAAHDRGYFKLPLEHLPNIIELTVNVLPPEYVQKVASSCPKLKKLHFCSVIESLKYLTTLKCLEDLDFRPTGGYLNGTQSTAQSLEDILSDFFNACGQRLKKLAFAQHHGVLRTKLPSIVFNQIKDNCLTLETLNLELDLKAQFASSLVLPNLKVFRFQGPAIDANQASALFNSCPKLTLIGDPSIHRRRDYKARIDHFAANFHQFPPY